MWKLSLCNRRFTTFIIHHKRTIRSKKFCNGRCVRRSSDLLRRIQAISDSESLVCCISSWSARLSRRNRNYSPPRVHRSVLQCPPFSWTPFTTVTLSATWLVSLRTRCSLEHTMDLSTAMKSWLLACLVPFLHTSHLLTRLSWEQETLKFWR